MMSHIEANLQLCKVLGIDLASTVDLTGFTLIVKAGQMPAITLTRHVRGDLAESEHQFHIVPIEPLALPAFDLDRMVDEAKHRLSVALDESVARHQFLMAIHSISKSSRFEVRSRAAAAALMPGWGAGWMAEVGPL